MKISDLTRPIYETDQIELPDLEVGDEMMVGKFKNRNATIKGFKTDKHNQPIAKTDKGDQQIFKGRIKKLITPTELVSKELDETYAPDNMEYFQIGHDRGDIMWFLDSSWKFRFIEDYNARQNHGNSYDYERFSIAVGRIDENDKKISIRDPDTRAGISIGVEDENVVPISEKNLNRIVKMFSRRYPEFDIWYFGISKTIPLIIH